MQPLKRLILWAVILLAACLLLECAVFQYDALRTRGLTPIALSLEDAAVQRQELPRELDDVRAVMPSAQSAKPVIQTTVAFSDLEFTDICTAKLTFSGDHQLISVRLLLSDDAHRYGEASADALPALPGQAAYGRLESHGALRSLSIVFETDDETAALSDIMLNAPIPYRFSPLRFAALLLPALAAAAVLCLRLWRVILDRQNPRHRLAFLLSGLACAGLVLAVSALCRPFDPARFPYTRGVEYPFESSVYQYRSLAHAVIYDSLAKGKTAADVSPDEKLLALDNPYDPTARMESGAETMLDYALYDGNYYSYFGLTPVLTFYAPYRLIMGYLPAYTTAACFYALLTVAAAFLCVWEALRRFAVSPSLLLSCLGAAAVALGGNALMLLSCADRYHLSISCMQAFFFLTLWAGLTACRQKKRLPRTLAFIACAVFTCFLVWSRATGALAAAGWIVPLFVTVLISRKHGGRCKLADALSFLLPLSAGAAAIMAYNAARFGSPLEFGQTWQLTLEDIHYNRVSLRELGQAIHYYFLDGLRLSPEFPFISPGSAFVNHTGNWFYHVVNAGALTMPVTWGVPLLAALPDKRRRGRMGVFLCAAMITVPLALLDYCVAGVAHRYVCDLLPTLCLAGMLALSELSGRDAAQGRGRASAISCALCAATLFIALCLAFSNYRNFISQYNPGGYLALYRLFTVR
ncbi:MAG: hypothetical protein IJ157_06330 [Clostridia bacterium]|nr:hypothetical protein [Clostridia bacterium]